MGVSANSVASRVLIHDRQEGSPVQHDSVAGIGSNFGSLAPVFFFFFQAYLITIQFAKKSFLVIIN